MKIGAYSVVAEIGRGGIGIVYRARDAAGRDVAIKLLQRVDPERVLRFDRERRLLEELGERDGFVPLLDAGESPAGPFIVMPFLEGGTLRERLRRGPLSIAETAGIGLSLARALGRAHERGIVHRDLKPENVIFGSGPEPLVLDLGLAKHWRAESASALSLALSKTGETLGTFCYMAPEQAADAKNVGPSADVFALGAILYECLTGQAAFTGETALEVFAKLASGDFEPVRRRRPDAPRWLADLVARALSPRAEDRHQDGVALAAALARGGPAGARSAWLGAAILAAGLVAVALAAAFLPAPRAAPPKAPPPQVPVGIALPEKPLPEKPLPEGRILKPVAAWGTLSGHHGVMVLHAAFSPDGKLLASSSMDGTARIWDAKDLRELRCFEGLTEPIGQVVFSPDSKRLLTGGRDRTVRVWDVESEKCLAVLEGFESGIGSIALSPDGKRFLTASDHRLGYFDVDPPKLVRWIDPELGGVGGAIFSADGKKAFASWEDNRLRRIDLARGAVEVAFDAAPARTLTLTLSTDGKTVLAGTMGHEAILWDAASGKETGRLGGHGDRVVCAVPSPDGKHYLTASFDRNSRIFSARTLELESVLEEGADRVTCACWSLDGTRIATGSNDGTLHLWDARTRREISAGASHRGRIMGVAVSEDGAKALTAGYDEVLRVWDARTGKLARELRGHATPIACVAISPDGRRAFTGGGREGSPGVGELLAWDLSSGDSSSLGRFESPVRAVAFSADGLHALSCAAEEGGTVMWDFSKGFPPGAIGSSKEATVAGAFLPGTARAAIATARSSFIWDVDEGRLDPFVNRRYPIVFLASRDALCVEGGLDGQIGAWDQRQLLNPMSKLEGHKQPVTSISIARDMKHVVSAAQDGVRYWTVENGGRALDAFDFHARRDVPRSVAFLPDGKSFLVGTERGGLLLYEIKER